MNLLELPLPAGDIAGFDIDYPASAGSSRIKVSRKDWSKYDGIRLIGKGPGKTFIRPNVGFTTSDDATINLGLESGFVQIESATIVCGPTMGIRAGLATKGQWAQKRPETPMTLKLVDYEILAEEKSMWGVFGYQSDGIFEHGVYNCFELREHGNYFHGWGEKGVSFDYIEFNSVGAECIKARCDPSEIEFTPNALVSVKHTNFRDWYQPHSSRGGGGLVLQGSHAHVHVADSMFYGDLIDPGRAKCFMVDDNGDKGHYGMGGIFNEGAATGHILIERTGIQGVAKEWFGEIAAVQSIRATGRITDLAQSLRVIDCGIYGDNTLFKIDGIDKVFFINNNTPEIKKIALARGFNTTTDTQLAPKDLPLLPINNYVS